MSKRLRDNLSSKYFEAANRLTAKTARRRVVAYVESYDDVFFWRSILNQVENDKLYFEVMLPSRDRRLERGKKAALMAVLADKVGQDMIACVDADYDYLTQGATETSKVINENPYVFHTYAYAIENLQCYGPSLHEVCVAVTLNDHQIFNFEEYLRQFSQAIFPLFVWNIWFYRSPNYKDFTINDMLHSIEMGHFSIRGAENQLSLLRQRVDKRVQGLQRHYPNARQSWQYVKNDIKRLGVTADTTYLYIQGHHLFDKVVVPMLSKVCEQLVRERQNEISRQSVHGTQRHNELSCYTSRVEDIESMLRKNTGFLRSEIGLRIKADLEQSVMKHDN
ncbi:MAG: DUF4435 domain-containing protein [Prevotella sp.]|jgi:hypothetical protein